jgi:hypothetical protein
MQMADFNSRKGHCKDFPQKSVADRGPAAIKGKIVATVLSGG